MIFNKVKEALVHYVWDLAYFEYDKDIVFNGLDFQRIHIVKNPYKNKWFADPFILQDTEDELTLFVEEFDKDIKKGRIARIVIDKKKDEIVSCNIILDLPTHLSFPVIYRIGERIIVHPENSASGASCMYEYDEVSMKLVNPVKVLNEPVTDAIIIREDGEYAMYATRVPESNGVNLRRYVSKELYGSYTFDRIVEYPHSRARMAGHFINYDGTIVRPAQDCYGAYGKAVIFYHGFTELGELRPSNYRYAGIHTFNRFNNICVIDIKRFDYPLLVLFKDKIKGLLWEK